MRHHRFACETQGFRLVRETSRRCPIAEKREAQVRPRDTTKKTEDRGIAAERLAPSGFKVSLLRKEELGEMAADARVSEHLNQRTCSPVGDWSKLGKALLPLSHPRCVFDTQPLTPLPTGQTIWHGGGLLSMKGGSGRGGSAL